MFPAIVMMTATAIWGIRRGNATGGAVAKFNWREARAALWEAKWELALPVIALAALFSGLTTPVEAAALTALYAFFVQPVFPPGFGIFMGWPTGVARVRVLC